MAWQQSDIATYGLNRPRGRFCEKFDTFTGYMWPLGCPSFHMSRLYCLTIFLPDYIAWQWSDLVQGNAVQCRNVQFNGLKCSSVKCIWQFQNISNRVEYTTLKGPCTIRTKVIYIFQGSTHFVVHTYLKKVCWDSHTTLIQWNRLGSSDDISRFAQLYLFENYFDGHLTTVFFGQPWHRQGDQESFIFFIFLLFLQVI